MNNTNDSSTFMRHKQILNLHTFLNSSKKYNAKIVFPQSGYFSCQCKNEFDLR